MKVTAGNFNVTDKDSVEWVIYQTLEDCERKKTDVAEDMNVPLSTLSREASPWDTGAKFGAGSLVSFMRATRSLAPLEYIAFKMGMRLVPLDAQPDGADLNEEINQAWEEAGTFLTKARNGAVCAMQMLGLRKQVAKEMDDVLARVQHKAGGKGDLE